MSIPEPGVLDLNATAGEAFSQVLRFKGAPSGLAIGLRGYTLRSQIRGEDGTTLAGEFAITITDVVAGEVRLELDAQQTAALPALGLWDLLVIEPNGDERIWLRGTITTAS